MHGISIASFGAATGAPVGVSSAKFNLAFLIFTGIVKKKKLKTTRNKKKHNETVMLARSKKWPLMRLLNIIKLLIKV